MPNDVAARYDAIWEAGAPEVRAGRAALDPWAARRSEDGRRGVTLLARPAPEVAAALAAFADELRRLEPDQYYHPAADLHVTILSLFTATADYAPYLAHVDAYRAAAGEAAGEAAPFAVDVRGVTLSSGAVLAQGVPRDDTLERLRERLRGALARRGLGGALDQRYRLRTAHLTLVRFVTPLRDPAAFVDALAAARGRDFGTSVVSRLELVLGDWYSSSARVERLGEYALPPASPASAPRPASR